MFEIFALPYFAISGVIGWAIFEPFFRTNDSDSLSPADITISDLLAATLPVSVLFSCARWMMPASVPSLFEQVIVVASALLFAVIALTAGLYLIPKKFQVTFFKRMAVVGIIAPFGLLLTIGWIGLLIWASAYSIVYLVPSSIAIAASTSVLRFLGFWVCQDESKVLEPSANPQL